MIHHNMSNSSFDDESKIKRAIYAFNNGVCKNLSQAAILFNVPYSRLRARHQVHSPRVGRVATHRKLFDAEEVAVCQYLDRLDHLGIPARPSMLLNYANVIFRQSQIDTTSPPPTVSEKWPGQFLKQHSEYFWQRQKTLDIHRKKSHNVESL